MIHTNRCKHCKKTIEEHWYLYCDKESQKTEFYDSGLFALDAHKEELYEAARELAELHTCEEEGMQSGQPTPQMWREATSKLWTIINQIEKEK